MMAFLLAAWRTGSVAKFAEIAGVLGIVFLAGIAFGNVRATRHALEAAQTRADTELADIEPPPLTPDQLFEGYANLAEDDRDVRGMLAALQQWIRERLGAE